MELMCRVRSTDTGQAVPNKIKRLLKNRKSIIKAKVNFSKITSLVDDQTATTTTTTIAADLQKIKSVSGTKRKSEDVLESRQLKRSKLDHCQGILAKLMRHKWSVPFCRPVDPCASGDYFQVIKHPIDFGTIKRNLQMNKYIDYEQFEADVRLVFTNATLYHPPQNWVHIYATKLSKLFNILWTPVKRKVIQEPTMKQNLSSRNESVKNTYDAEGTCPEAVQNYSPATALRTAELKSRFADTILRAQIKNHTQKLEKKKLTEKLEDEVIVAESAFRVNAKLQLKKMRQQMREAARASIEKMVQSVHLDDNLPAMIEFEAWIGSSDSRKTDCPLERLGLYLKTEYMVCDDYDDEVFLQDTDLEDGEIFD